MNNIDKSKYPQMPQSFHNKIEETFNIIEKNNIRPFKSQKNVKVILVAAIIIVLLTLSVFAGGKVYSNWIAQKNYQVTLVPEQKTVTKEFVDIKFNYLPQGLMESDEYHYYFNNDFKGGLSLSLYRLDEYSEIDIKYSVGYEEKTFGQNKGAIISKPDDYNMNRELIIYFDNDGYMLRAYVGKDISDEEIVKIAEGIELVETDEEHAFKCEHKPEVPSTLYFVTQKTDFSENEVRHIGDKITGLYAWDVNHSEKSESSIDVTVEKVDFYDNINKFNKDNFNYDYILEKSPLTDENGNLLPYERTNMKYGDGVNSINEVESVETVNNKFMCVTVTIENTSNVNREFFVSQINPALFTETNGALSQKMKDFCSGKFYNETVYVSSQDSKSSFNCKKIKAGESIKVQIGYFVDEDKIDDIYLTIGRDGEKTKQIVSIH